MPAYPLQVVDVTSVSVYPAHTAPQVMVGFIPEDYWFLNTSATAKIFISFDGVNDNIALNAGDSITWPSSDQRVWVRNGGGGGSATLQVAAAGRELA